MLATGLGELHGQVFVGVLGRGAWAVAYESELEFARKDAWESARKGAWLKDVREGTTFSGSVSPKAWLKERA